MTEDAALHPAEKQVYLRAKLDASYWLGLIAQQRANYPAAVDYFIHRTLEALPNGPWTHGAKYNLARIYETSDERKKAVMLYRSDSRSPSHHGNLLRARWLESQLTEAAAPEEG